MNGNTIAENVVALIRRDKVYKALKLTKGKKVHFDKLSFFPDHAFGCYYGSQFEVHSQQLVLVARSDVVSDGAGMAECGLDNRDIVDDGSAQALKESDILRLRAQTRGQDVVGTVVEHSTSFKGKTKYAQEKYIDKKKKKHAPVIIILEPSTKALCEMYYSRGPSKICHMRADTVGQILTYSNVHAHTNMIIMETTQGLLLTALLERMGGFGNLVQIFFGDFPVKLALDNASHLSEKDKAPLLEYPLNRIRFPAILHSSVLCSINESMTACTVPLTNTLDSSGPIDVEHSSPLMTSLDSDDNRMDLGSDEDCEPQPPKKVKTLVEVDSVAEERDDMKPLPQEPPPLSGDFMEGTREQRERRRHERETRYLAAETLLLKRSMDGLVLACRFHPEPLLMALLGFLSPSRPVVVYCHLLEPLVECYKTLKCCEPEIVFDVQISETWTRYYQILPERTHPAMNMDGQGGYLLTATTIQKS